jgi:hypothetical protein
VRRGLVGDEVEGLTPADELRHDVGRVPAHSHRQRASILRRSTNARQRVVQGVRRLVEVARLDAAPDPFRIDLDAQDRRARHGRRERLRAAHAAEPGGQDRPAAQVGRPEVRLPRRRERLVRPLQDSLRADVDPAPGRHLAEHRQAEILEPAKFLPRRPARDEQCVGDQHSRRAGVRREHTDRLAALHEEGLVLAQREE